eukprot:CAMPEP_0183411716 /NCGR_PEP_ID=MMETSP0370-20130417/20509_1 /TAXON_ID=268820 /ORGANISM="Peridinium aciculiferum, Strain PAER-2" /LENGTH=66 /DNA_ID=CAMNT_0025594729 /DNA_START=32 /DNA_END=230 /DNA_ORIENTATION=+
MIEALAILIVGVTAGGASHVCWQCDCVRWWYESPLRPLFAGLLTHLFASCCLQPAAAKVMDMVSLG